MTQDSGTSLSLLERIKNGDHSGWQRVVELYSPLCSYWCRRWGIEGADADDVLQEVFRSAAESIATFHRECEGDSFARPGRSCENPGCSLFPPKPPPLRQQLPAARRPNAGCLKFPSPRPPNLPTRKRQSSSRQVASLRPGPASRRV